MYLNNVVRADTVSAMAGCHSCPAKLYGLCAKLEAQDLDALRHCGTRRRLEPDTALVHHGDAVRDVVSVVKGVLRLSHLLPDGRRQIAAFAFPGDFLGISFDEHHQFTVEAVTSAELCIVPKQRFEKFVQENPCMAAPLYATAVHELAKARDHLVLLGRKTAQERLATFILQMAEHTEQKPDGTLRASLPMNRTDIADHLGLRIETVCRELTIMKAADLVTLDSTQEILIVDPDALHERACAEYEGRWSRSNRLN